jgi:hypothetical protein
MGNSMNYDKFKQFTYDLSKDDAASIKEQLAKPGRVEVFVHSSRHEGMAQEFNSYLTEQCETDEERMQLIREALEGICRNCGMVTKNCYCMNDE